MNESEMIQAIETNPFDETCRRGYAEWLDAKGDERGEFLLIQMRLVQLSPNSDNYLALCKRERDLITEIDPNWVRRFQKFTTAPPCRDIVRLVPELSPFARTTVRLHPHRNCHNGHPDQSKIGGVLLWPQDEAWPTCADCRTPLVPILQLRDYDVPNIAFPPQTDLCQILWCPFEAMHDNQPKPIVIWRKCDSIGERRAKNPDYCEFGIDEDNDEFAAQLVPTPCSVYPERVIEYPTFDDLRKLLGHDNARAISDKIKGADLGDLDDLAERFNCFYGPKDANDLAFGELTECPGTKVGGKPSINHEGKTFEHLLTLSTYEFDSGSFRRWLPLEDQRWFADVGQPLTWDRLFKESDFRPVVEATGMELGRTQRMYFFICRETTPWSLYSEIND